MVASWNDLPFEMKREIFKYLTFYERFIFAQCVPDVFLDVFQYEKKFVKVYFEKTKYSKVDLKPEHGYLLSVGMKGLKYRVEIEFGRVDDCCELRWKWGDKMVGREKKETKDITRLAFEYFESILWRIRDSIEILVLNKIDINFSTFLQPISTFPEMKTLIVKTNNENTLYWLLSKSPTIRKLVVSFQRFGEPKAEIEPILDWQMGVLYHFVAQTNDPSVVENIVQRTESVASSQLKFFGNEIPRKDSVVFTKLYKYKTALSLDTPQRLTNQQLHRLMRIYEYVRCSKGRITNGGIHKLIENIMNTGTAVPNRGFCIYDVGTRILRSNSFDFKYTKIKGKDNKKEHLYVHTRVKDWSIRGRKKTGVLTYNRETRTVKFEMKLAKNSDRPHRQAPNVQRRIVFDDDNQVMIDHVDLRENDIDDELMNAFVQQQI